MEEQQNRPHRAKSRDRKGKQPERGKNPKAFSFQSGEKANRIARRNAQLDQHRLHPVARPGDLANGQGQPVAGSSKDLDSPPVIVAIIGPPGVGKTTLLRSLVRRYTKTSMNDIAGPVTVVSGKTRRLTFIEVPNDIGSVVDISKIADLVLLVIDGSFGFEMETFEAITALQSHGMPKLIAILTHLDLIKKPDALKAQKKRLKQRLWTEIYDGAKVFYLSGVWNGRYPDREILNLCRFINVTKFRPLSFRSQHAYLLADRFEDLTPREQVRLEAKRDRTIAVSGYLRGIALRPPASDAEPLRFHIPGSGVDVLLGVSLQALADPCPLPTRDGEKRRKMSERHRLIHAPMSGGAGGGLSFDGDKLWITTGGSFSKASSMQDQEDFIGEGERMVMELQDADMTLDENTVRANLHLFEGSTTVRGLPGEEAATEPVINVHRRAAPHSELFDEKNGTAESAHSDSDSEADDSEDLLADIPSDASQTPQWKANLSERAQRAFVAGSSRRSRSLADLIYATDLEPTTVLSVPEPDSTMLNDDSLFAPLVLPHEPEHHFRWLLPAMQLRDLHSEESLEAMRPHFITGDAVHRLPDAKEADGSETGDFEDLEAEPPLLKTISCEDLAAKKATLKRKFDQQYDGSSEEGEEIDFFAKQKVEMAGRVQSTRAEFDDLDERTRLRVEGHRPGTYVRLELRDVPCELVDNFEARRPLLIGGLLGHEEEHGYLQVRLKRHRWHHKILKSNDPLFVSMGWRRFQTLPVYSLDDGTRNRMLKYTPEHMHCLATFWAPGAVAGTGLCAFSNLSASVAGFRVSATGVVTEVDTGSRIVKKLKLTGTPFKIFKNTAFVKDMFTSSLEIAKFEGAHLRTVSGIRGQVKKALAKPEGCFRAVFEDRVLASDIIFLRSWSSVEPRRYCAPIGDLVQGDQSAWSGMRLTGAVRHEAGLSTPQQVNSLYKPVARETRRFNPLKVPKKLQAALPFASKPKLQMPQEQPTYRQQRAVVVEAEEKKALGLLQQIRAIEKVKDAKRRQKKHEKNAEHRAKVAKTDTERREHEREDRREYFREQGKAEKAKNASRAKKRP